MSRPLPPGWACHDVSAMYHDDIPLVYLDGHMSDQYAFKHSAAPNWEWRHPFPVPEIEASTPPATADQTPYLFAETDRTYLWANRDGPESCPEDWSVGVPLFSRSGRYVSDVFYTLRIHYWQQEHWRHRHMSSSLSAKLASTIVDGLVGTNSGMNSKISHGETR